LFFFFFLLIFVTVVIEYYQQMKEIMVHQPIASLVGTCGFSPDRALPDADAASSAACCLFHHLTCS
jgi:hypothetical protein